MVVVKQILIGPVLLFPSFFKQKIIFREKNFISAIQMFEFEVDKIRIVLIRLEWFG